LNREKKTTEIEKAKIPLDLTAAPKKACRQINPDLSKLTQNKI